LIIVKPAIAFENDQDQNLDAFVFSSLANSYFPQLHASFNLALNLPSDPTSIKNYDQCVTISAQIPYFKEPTLNSMFPHRSSNSLISLQEYSSLLPLLITAHRNDVNIHQYDIVSERTSFRKIAMNNKDYIVGVMKFGSTLFLRRHGDYIADRSDVGYRFERMCTPT
jgi:hypothetical protein